MNHYKYRAINNSTNKIVNGQMEAVNEIVLEQILSGNNLLLIQCSEIKVSILTHFFIKKITNKDLILLFSSLLQLERAGVPLIDSLKDIKSYTTNQNLRNIGESLYDSVKSGLLLSQAMSKHTKVFDEISISLIAMSEKTGNLSMALENIIENLKWGMEIKRKINKAIKGPIFILILMLLIIIVMLRFVIPSIITFVLDLEASVPLATKSLISTSEFVQKYFLFIIFIPIMIFVGIKIICKFNENFSVSIDNMKLNMPIIGEVIKKIELSRFAKFFSLTFAAKIPILECMDILIKVIQNKKIKQDIVQIKNHLASGIKISQSLKEVPLFSIIVVKMFEIGENTGNMESSLANINYFYDMEISDTIENIIAAIKPIMMFILGSILGWIIVGVFGPIYGSFSKVL